SGFLTGALLSLLIWHGLRGRSLGQKIAAVAAWLSFQGAVALIALRGFEAGAFSASSDPVSVLDLFDRPWMRLQYILVLLGQMLGKGPAFAPEMLCALLGGAVLVVFVGCTAFVFYRRREAELVSASLPWIICGLYGIGTSVLICLGRMNKTFRHALAERFVIF